MRGVFSYARSGFANESNIKSVCAFSEGKPAHGASSSLFTKNQRATNELHLAAKKGSARKMLMVGTNVLPFQDAHSTHVIATCVCAWRSPPSRLKGAFFLHVFNAKDAFSLSHWLQFRTSLAPFTPQGQKSHFPAARFVKSIHSALRNLRTA